VLIAEGESVTRTAEKIGRTQSAVSMQMRRLEEVLGEALLRRGHRGPRRVARDAGGRDGAPRAPGS
jgi:DNA-binding transcriptional LysR family regulator